MVTGHALEKIINGPAHHTLHHLYFTVNYGQVCTFSYSSQVLYSHSAFLKSISRSQIGWAIRTANLPPSSTLSTTSRRLKKSSGKRLWAKSNRLRRYSHRISKNELTTSPTQNVHAVLSYHILYADRPSPPDGVVLRHHP
jgi:hypothetical protein